MLATTTYKTSLMKNKCKMASMLKKISLSGNISITKRCFVINFYLSIFISHQDLSFGAIALKVEFVVFVYELINYEIIFFITWLCNY